jgi:hypothetical protein
MSNASEPRTPKPRLRWYQYRLRTLLIVMTLLAIWMAHISHRARQQKLAVERILRLDGVIKYDYEEPTANFPDCITRDSSIREFLTPTPPPPPGPTWLRSLLGEDYFQTVVALGLCNSIVNDGDLSVLLNLPDLKILRLDNNNFTDDALAYVKKLNKLEILYIRGTAISDQGLEQLKELPHLQKLTLSYTKVTDEGIKQLQAACPKIEIIREGY